MTTSLLIYRREFGYAMGDLATYVAQAGADTHSVIITELISALATASKTRYGGQWIINSTKGQQRRVRTNGYTPATGTLLVDPPWTTPAAGDRIDITGLFPATEDVFSPGPSYKTLLNNVLRMIVQSRRISLPIVPGQSSYSLSTYVEWINEERFGWPDLPSGEPQPRMLEPSPGGGPPVPADWRRPSLNLDGASPTLEIEAPFVAGTVGSITLNTMCPAFFFINGTDSTVGLQADTDTALPSLDDVLKIGKWLAYEVLAIRGASTSDGTPYAAMVAPQKALAMTVKHFDRTAYVAPTAPQPAAQAA